MKTIAIALVIVGSLVVVTGSASARTKKFPTQITIQGEQETSSNQTLIDGYVDSPKARCLSNRTVGIFAKDSTGATGLLDVARTGLGGGWAGRTEQFSG